ncbi:alpha/beta hydrolase [Sulfitobacter donghicola]|uniref:Lipase/esterase n=1 Tax=Sulfitobacter donghicola DSW-25 = KCTC 12864 = JCM 14565 TaxID=1300350 RepID=A0A073IJT4_9RHOB|nr:alpha/beta hydrolase [Sulfitobacter donghicola]KEJ89860.1 lipase/esterase [Sulfitobacter donghicola DSW-25 = KCTC 12864 = JCM 14565]KIN67019.1 Alpha/beta hydrolase fold-3 domain protein [Sulfitobacter donghicola DSW-25 = KCTC 12864 = JCM 14565]
MSQTNYGALLDDEVRAYIARGAAFYPPDAVDLTIEQQRAVYDDMCAAFHAGRPANVVTWDEPLGGIPCRRYEAGATDVTLIYYHGGGFVVGGLHSHDDVCAELAARAGVRVISVDYGLAPENIFPNCYNDAKSAFDAITQSFTGQFLLAGDSAGGNLAAAVAHHSRGQVAGQVLIYPGLGGDPTKGSYVEHANAPELTTRDMQFYQTIRTGGKTPPTDDPRYAPLHDTDFTGLPPTVIVTAACDPLASDGESYRDALRAAGGQAVWFNEAGLVHGCLRARKVSKRGAAFFDRVAVAVEALAKGEWPY